MEDKKICDMITDFTSPSPMPKNINPKHKKKVVEVFGFKFKGLCELHETLGTFLIDKNIFLITIYWVYIIFTS